MKLRILIVFLISGSFSLLKAQNSPFSSQSGALYGGTGDDLSTFITQNKFGDYFITGKTNSQNNDIVSPRGVYDIWLAKLGRTGQIKWKKNIGSTGDDYPISITSDPAGNVVVLGYGGAKTGDFSSASGSGLWFLKLDSAGNNPSFVYHGGEPGNTGKIVPDQAGGFYILSSRNTANGLVAPVEGTQDMWLIHTNGAGVSIGQKVYGGSGIENAGDLIKKGDFLYILGQSNSSSVNGAVNHGQNDLLWIKTDLSGNAIATQMYGGSLNEIPNSIILGESTFDPFFVLSTSQSSNGDLPGSNSGGFDFWAFGIDESGNISLGTNIYYGTNENETAAGLFYDDSNPSEPLGIVGSTVYTFELGQPAFENAILIRFAPFSIQPDTVFVFGGDLDDFATDFMVNNLGDLVFTGYSESSNGDFSGNHGGKDFWFYQLNYPCPNTINIQGTVVQGNFTRYADQSIQTSSVFQGGGSQMLLTAPFVLMQPGFEVKSGVIFKAEPGACP